MAKEGTQRSKLIFPNLPELERRKFISMLFDAINTDNASYYEAANIVRKANDKGMFDKINHFNKNFSDK